MEPRFQRAVKCRENNCRAKCATPNSADRGPKRTGLQSGAEVPTGSDLRRSRRTGAWRCLVILRVDDHRPSSAFAIALGAQIFFLAQAPDARCGARARTWARSGRARSSVAPAPPPPAPQFATRRCASPEILAVEPDLFVLVALQVQISEASNSKERSNSPPRSSKSRIRPGKLHQNFRMLPLAILRYRRIDGDPILQFEAAVGNDGLQKFTNLFGSSNFVSDWHK
jgi:hypothetical protein